MRVFLNPGHDTTYDSGAVNPRTGLRECDVAAEVGALVQGYLEQAGCEVAALQSDNLNGESPWLPCVVQSANAWPADIFVSLHCNATNGQARGTETLVFMAGGESEQLARCIQQRMVDAVDTVDRGVKEREGLCVLRRTAMPAVLVEMAFIDNDEDARLLTEQTDEIARAIARGVTDYEQEVIE